jgi:hypothetical protein
LVVGVVAAVVTLIVAIPANIIISSYIAERARTLLDATYNTSLRPATFAVKAEHRNGQSLFYPDVEITNLGPRTAVRAKVLVTPLLCSVKLGLKSANTIPSGHTINFQESPLTASDCNERVIEIARIDPGQRLILHYEARATEYIPDAGPVKIVTARIERTDVRPHPHE